MYDMYGSLKMEDGHKQQRNAEAGSIAVLLLQGRGWKCAIVSNLKDCDVVVFGCGGMREILAAKMALLHSASERSSK